MFPETYTVPKNYRQLSLTEQTDYWLSLINQSKQVRALKTRVLAGDMTAWIQLLYQYSQSMEQYHNEKRRPVPFKYIQEYVYTHIDPSICRRPGNEIAMILIDLMNQGYENVMYLMNISDFAFICSCRQCWRKFSPRKNGSIKRN